MVVGEFNFLAYLGIGFTFSVAILFWSVRSASPSQMLDAILLIGIPDIPAGKHHCILCSMERQLHGLTIRLSGRRGVAGDGSLVLLRPPCEQVCQRN